MTTTGAFSTRLSTVWNRMPRGVLAPLPRLPFQQQSGAHCDGGARGRLVAG